MCPLPSSCSGTRRHASMRSASRSSLTSRRARVRSPAAARATVAATSGGWPSASRLSIIAWFVTGDMRMTTAREAMVVISEGRSSARRSHTVEAGGSSITLRSIENASSPLVSKRGITSTFRAPSVGARWASRMISVTSGLRSWLPSRSMVRKSVQLPSAMSDRTRAAAAASRPAARTSPAKAAATARAPQPSAPSSR